MNESRQSKNSFEVDIGLCVGMALLVFTAIEAVVDMGRWGGGGGGGGVNLSCNG